MTVKNLHNFLTKAVLNGHGRKRVVINKPSFTHALEADGCVFIDAHHVEFQSIDLLDDDGGMACDSRGRQKSFTALVVDGGNDPCLFEDKSK